MTTTLKLKFVRETPLARLYEDQRGHRQWVPRSVCPQTTKLGDVHEVRIEDWWLAENPFEKKAAPQAELLKETKQTFLSVFSDESNPKAAGILDPLPMTLPTLALDLLADLYAASAELRFHIKTLNLPRVEQNASWHRHTEVMRRAEVMIKTKSESDLTPAELHRLNELMEKKVLADGHRSEPLQTKTTTKTT